MPAERRASSRNLFVQEGLTAIRERLEVLLGADAQVEFISAGSLREALIRHGGCSWIGRGDTVLEALEDVIQKIALSQEAGDERKSEPSIGSGVLEDHPEIEADRVPRPMKELVQRRSRLACFLAAISSCTSDAIADGPARPN